MLNILVACKTQKEPGGLAHVGACCIHYDTSPNWASAANALLAQAQSIGGDALFLDDDTELTPGCLDAVFSHYSRASLFGLDLHDMGGRRQAGARHTIDQAGNLADWTHPGPAYVAHVSTSAIYIKAEALGLRFPEWDGIHWEDVAFCLDAWLHGFRVMAVPGLIHHAIVAGVGATKRGDADFWEKWARNRQSFGQWMGERGVIRALADERIPMGAAHVAN